MDFILENYLLIWVIIIGLCLGSFYNVVILRSLSGESLVFPSSKCPKCQNKLKPWHNIPVLSYIFLGGKCAFCKEKISIQYPIIELLTALFFATAYLKFDLTWKFAFAIILCSGLLIMSMTDLKEKLVDCNIAIGLAIIGLCYNGFANGNLLNSIYGLVAGIIIMEILARVGYFFTRSRAFGEADTYVAGALGACFGLQGLLTVLVYTLIAAMIFIVPMFLYKQYKENNKKTCILSILFTLSILVFYTVSQNIYSSLAVILTGILLAISVLKKIKPNAALTYLPLVPAFALAALYYFFL